MEVSESTVKNEHPSTPSMLTTTTATSSTHPEDAELISQLANLQQMHHHLHHLRTLLPSALIGPARAALSQQNRTSPQSVAEDVIKAARQGKADIRDFQKHWYDEKTRQLFKDANSAETTQGVDAWMVDYEALLNSRPTVTSEAVEDKTKDDDFDTPEQARTVLDKVSNDDSSHLKLEPDTDLDKFPIAISLGKLRFAILNDEAPRTYLIQAASKQSLAQQISKRLNKEGSAGSGVWKKLEGLLDTLKQYYEAETTKCAKCDSLVDENLDYALARRAETNKNPSGQTVTEWKAYHDTCLPE